jgi:hypothetical protein
MIRTMYSNVSFSQQNQVIELLITEQKKIKSFNVTSYTISHGTFKNNMD